MDTIVKAIGALVSSLGAALVEREAEIRAIVLALVAREHVLLVGPPGTGKSHLCRSVAQGIDGAVYCERLLSPTTDPDEVFGPIDPIAYRDSGKLLHKSENYVAGAHIVFLDEFFRASDCIQDAMLHAMGPERQSLVDGQQIKMPAISFIGSANTFSDNAHQQAILDRWLIRKIVKPVSRGGRERLLWDSLPSVSPVMTLADLDSASAAAKSIPVSQDAREGMAQIVDELVAAGIRPSDRRLRASVKVARASAFIEAHPEVTRYDLECLADVLWDCPGEQQEKASEIVCRIANPVGARINSILAEIDQIVSASADAPARMAAIKKLEESERECQKLSVSGNGRAYKALAFIGQEKLKLQALALGIDPAKAAQLFAAK